MPATVSLWVERYAYPRVSAVIDVPAKIIGALAVHKSAYWGSGDVPDAKAATARGLWTVSHVATGLQACPPDVKYWLSDCQRRTAIDFATRWQAEIPEFFAAISELPREFFLDAEAIAKRSDLKELMRGAIDAARKIRDNMRKPLGYDL